VSLPFNAQRIFKSDGITNIHCQHRQCRHEHDDNQRSGEQPSPQLHEMFPPVITSALQKAIFSILLPALRGYKRTVL
jgi:hypothetical protein